MNVFTSLHRHTSLVNSVRWQTLRLIDDFVPFRLHHRLSAILDCPPSVTGLFWLPQLLFVTVCLNTSPPHPLCLSSSPILRLICSQSCISPLSLYSARAVTFIALDTIITRVWKCNTWPFVELFYDLHSRHTISCPSFTPHHLLSILLCCSFCNILFSQPFPITIMFLLTQFLTL